jgi:acyl-homoserine lactone acylase PvdQ
MVYADCDENIGFMVPGRIPIRKAGDGHMSVPGLLRGPRLVRL